MNTITTKDGTEIYYKECGLGQPAVFNHGHSTGDGDVARCIMRHSAKRVTKVMLVGAVKPLVETVTRRKKI